LIFFLSYISRHIRYIIVLLPFLITINWRRNLAGTKGCICFLFDYPISLVWIIYCLLISLTDTLLVIFYGLSCFPPLISRLFRRSSFMPFIRNDRKAKRTALRIMVHHFRLYITLILSCSDLCGIIFIFICMITKQIFDCLFL